MIMILDLKKKDFALLKPALINSRSDVSHTKESF